MTPKGTRTRRVGDLIQEEISALLVRGLKDPRLEGVTIMGVDVSPDLRSAKIYYTVLGDPSRKDDALSGLQSASGFIRSHLAKTLHMKFAPKLTYAYDASIDQGERINRLLAQALTGKTKQEDS